MGRRSDKQLIRLNPLIQLHLIPELPKSFHPLEIFLIYYER
jgi:hypothetical protein